MTVNVDSPVLAWHFARDDRRLGYDDGRRIFVGRTLHVEGPLKLCEHGLHGSKDVLDALSFAQGEWLCRTAHVGEVLEGTDKFCSTGRRVLEAHRVDLHSFARWCATQVIDLWTAPQVVIDYLHSGDESIRAAAWAAARAAAWARAAAGADAGARAAAGAGAAAGAAAMAAARDAQRAELLRRWKEQP